MLARHSNHSAPYKQQETCCIDLIWLMEPRRIENAATPLLLDSCRNCRDLAGWQQFSILTRYLYRCDMVSWDWDLITFFAFCILLHIHRFPSFNPATLPGRAGLAGLCPCSRCFETGHAWHAWRAWHSAWQWETRAPRVVSSMQTSCRRESRSAGAKAVVTMPTHAHTLKSLEHPSLILCLLWKRMK